ncbi:MAG: signal peptidase II [Lachnospiraceae bacterium]|nr:signal peptidase II [Lachnospiraceae bacterium]
MVVFCLCLVAAIFAGGQLLRSHIEKNRDGAQKAESPAETGAQKVESPAEPGAQKAEPSSKSGFIMRRYSRNSGAVMNLAEKHAKLVTGFAVAVFLMVVVWFCILIPKKGMRLMKTGIAVMLGGALGNIYERVRKGYVTDYFSFCFLKKIIFNINDMFIIAGSLLTLAGL